MTDQVKTCFRRLEKLSEAELDRSAIQLVRSESEHVARLIAHLAEIARRGAYRVWGYSSLFDYARRRLNLGEGTVWRRLQVARACRQFPQLLEALWDHSIHLSAASLLAPHLSPDNVEGLLAQARGKSKREVEKIVAGESPRPLFETSIRTVAL